MTRRMSLCISALLGLCFIFSQCESSGCDSGWASRPGSTSCYNFVTTKTMAWAQAQGLCRDMGGYLAILDTVDEIIWMKGHRIHHPILRPQSFWIGGYQRSGKWLWHGDLTDHAILATDWRPPNPDNAGRQEGAPGSQDCISQYSAPSRFTWDDNDCVNKLQFICEKNARK